MPEPKLIIETDASHTGWSVCITEESHKGKTTGGNWIASEAKEHVKYLEHLVCISTKKGELKKNVTG